MVRWVDRPKKPVAVDYANAAWFLDPKLHVLPPAHAARRVRSRCPRRNCTQEWRSCHKDKPCFLGEMDVFNAALTSRLSHLAEAARSSRREIGVHDRKQAPDASQCPLAPSPLNLASLTEETRWISSAFLREPPISRLTGEDMHLSYMLRKVLGPRLPV